MGNTTPAIADSDLDRAHSLLDSLDLNSDGLDDVQSIKSRQLMIEYADVFSSKYPRATDIHYREWTTL